MTNEIFYHRIENLFSKTRKNSEVDLNPFNLIDLAMLNKVDKLDSLAKILIIVTVALIMTSLFFSFALAASVIEINGPKIYAGTKRIIYCGNNQTSCGDPNHCVDLTGMVYCVRGRVVTTKCLSNNIRNETLTTSCGGGDFKLRLKDSKGNDSAANITMYTKDSSNIIGRSSVNGEGNLNSLENNGDMDFDFRNSEFNFLIKGVTLDNEDHNFMIDKVTARIPGATVFKTLYVNLPPNFSFTRIVLKIKYSDVTASESSLTLYKCSNFNATSGECNGSWQTIPIIKDSINKMIIADVNSFSAYALGDAGTNTTTTTSTTTTSTSTTSTTSTTTTTTTSTPPATNPNSGSGDDSSDTGSTTTTTETTEIIASTENPTTTTTSASENTTAESNTTSIQDSGMTTGFFSMVSNYMSIVLPASAMAGALIYNFFRKNKSYSSSSYAKYGKVKHTGKKSKRTRGTVLNI